MLAFYGALFRCCSLVGSVRAPGEDTRPPVPDCMQYTFLCDRSAPRMTRSNNDTSPSLRASSTAASERVSCRTSSASTAMAAEQHVSRERDPGGIRYGMEFVEALDQLPCRHHARPAKPCHCHLGKRRHGVAARVKQAGYRLY